jgi:predicted metal-dependent enzyme (double-stranded beta helix superfamily)
MRPVFIDPTRTTAFEMDGITFHLRTLTARELIYVEQAAEPLVRRYTDAKATAGEGADESTYDIDLSPGDLSGLHDCLRIGIVGWEGESAPALSLVETKDNGIRRR